jgi:hypothetical protein
METSFFTGFGHLCRFICMGAIVVTSINATLRDADYFTIRSPFESTQKLIEFRGESTKNKKVALKWKLSTQGNYAYTIEKSRDGENFTEVETSNIKAEEHGEFTWVDAFPKTVNCYRLKLTDDKGVTTFSKVLVIQVFKTGQVSLVGATPDLTANDISVDVQMKEDAMVTLKITDKEGKVIMQQKERAKEGMNQYSIKGSSSINPGDYFLNVVVNGADCLLVHLIKS